MFWELELLKVIFKKETYCPKSVKLDFAFIRRYPYKTRYTVSICMDNIMIFSYLQQRIYEYYKAKNLLICLPFFDFFLNDSRFRRLFLFGRPTSSVPNPTLPRGVTSYLRVQNFSILTKYFHKHTFRICFTQLKSSADLNWSNIRPFAHYTMNTSNCSNDPKLL